MSSYQKIQEQPDIVLGKSFPDEQSYSHHEYQSVLSYRPDIPKVLLYILLTESRRNDRSRVNRPLQSGQVFMVLLRFRYDRIDCPVFFGKQYCVPCQDIIDTITTRTFFLINIS
jgi:hypothetical protein